MNEEDFVAQLSTIIESGFKDSKVHCDLVNNRIMVSFINNDDGFDIKVEKE